MVCDLSTVHCRVVDNTASPVKFFPKTSICVDLLLFVWWGFFFVCFPNLDWPSACVVGGFSRLSQWTLCRWKWRNSCPTGFVHGWKMVNLSVAENGPPRGIHGLIHNLLRWWETIFTENAERLKSYQSEVWKVLYLNTWNFMSISDNCCTTGKKKTQTSDLVWTCGKVHHYMWQMVTVFHPL